MSKIHLKIENMWWLNEKPALLFRAASQLYRVINHCNLKGRKRRSVAPPLPMISVGNLTVGGSGKTPFVIWLALLLKKSGLKPVIISRGDGGKSGVPQLLNDQSDPFTVGDEALLLYRKCDCPVIAGRDRIRASRMAAEYGDIIILDDGFQYRQLKRSCDIVLIPAEGVGNNHLIPAGPLREPLEALDRADLIVRTGQPGERQSDEHKSDEIKPLTTGKEWRWWSCEKQLVQLAGEKAEAPKRAVALTAIARPQRFILSLEKLDIGIEEACLFPDHHPFSEADIRLATAHNLPVIVTAKDAVKLQNIWPANQELWVLEQSAEAEAGLFEAIKTILDNAGA
ncbi:MAG: tetraacyldisaccharide 4'-kinase [Mariprofundaceae bacterium]